MKKKALCLFLSLALALSLIPASVLAAENSSDNVNYTQIVINTLAAMYPNEDLICDEVIPLKGFSGESEYVLVTFLNDGYAIVSMSTERIVEAMVDGNNPYQNCASDLYYGGPFNYLYKDNDANLRSVESNEIVSEVTLAKMSAQVTESLNRSETTKTEVSSAARASYPASAIVTYSDYIINSMPFGNNVDGTCGSVAAGMMLIYIDCKVKTPGTIVPSSIGYGEPLHQSLTTHCEGTSGSTSASVCSGINDWFEMNEDDYGVTQIMTAHYFYVLWGSYAKTSIAAGKPCVLALGEILGSPYGNHQVLAFGYYSNANGDYYNIHVGWHGSGYSNAILDSSWAIGVCYLS